MARKRFPAIAVVFLLLAWGEVVSAQNVTTGGEGLSIKGFVNASAFFQNQSFTFGNGQNAEFPNPPQTRTDRWILDGDVRNTRLTLGWTGPKLEGDLKVGATVEFDFFGGFNGTGGFSNAQEIPRMRLGYVDFIKGKTTIRIGQGWAPLFGTTAVSLSHIAFPLGYGAAGDIGWRFPGIFVYRDLSPSAKVTVALMRNAWNGPGNNIDSGSAGPASTLPQVEARLDLNGKKGTNTWNTYFVGHVDKKDLSGANAKASNDSLTGWAVEAGGKLTAGAFMIQGNVFDGKAIGQQFGQLAQFGDIKSFGAWAQGGFNINKKWAAYLFAGSEKPKKSDVIAAKQTRSKNVMVVPSLMYTTGPYGFNLEWLHDKVTTVATSGAETDTKGDQFAASVIYRF